MYFTYLDEAGTSNPRHEPWVVVAGVLVSHKEWRPIETRLIELADEYAPIGKRDGFVFHAKESWSGGKDFNRETYDPTRRFDALRQLCALIGAFRLPIVQGCIHRMSYIEREGIPQPFHSEAAIEAKVVGFSYCVMAADGLMRLAKDEITTVTVERNSQTLRLYRDAQRSLKNGELLRRNPDFSKWLPLERVVDTVNECEKQDSSILQLADVVAFVIKKHM